MSQLVNVIGTAQDVSYLIPVSSRLAIVLCVSMVDELTSKCDWYSSGCVSYLISVSSRPAVVLCVSMVDESTSECDWFSSGCVSYLIPAFSRPAVVLCQHGR
jgi:hypothetical protein